MSSSEEAQKSVIAYLQLTGLLQLRGFLQVHIDNALTDSVRDSLISSQYYLQEAIDKIEQQYPSGKENKDA